jgi:hypothetical protein
MERISVICLAIACAAFMVWNNWPGERPSEPRPAADTPTEEALRSIRGTGDNTAVGAWALEQRSGEDTTFVGSVRKAP